MFKSGFVNIIGLPNAGKSSIINRLLDDKFSIVTSKAQTTRHRAHAIINGEDFQVVISDTPGFTIPKNKIHEYMNKKILSSFKDADIILFIVELGAENRRDNQFIDLELINIDGIGEKTAVSLMKQFKSVKNIKSKSLYDLKIAIGDKKGTIIYNYYNK